MDNTVAYLLLLAGILAGLCVLVFRLRRHVWVYFLAFFAYYHAAVCGAYYLIRYGDIFELFRLLAYAVFLGSFMLFIIMAVAASKRYKVLASFFALLAFATAGVAADAFLLEPTALEVTHYSIASAKLERAIKVAVVSDLQTEKVSDYDRRVLTAVMNEKPDVILMPGDYLQVSNPGQHRVQAQKLNELFRRLHFGAPLGVYAVHGDQEGDGWEHLFDGLSVTALSETKTVELPALAITGLSYGDSGNADLKVPASRTYHIVFGHRPEFMLAHPAADLLVAGHTHGGQVHLPFVEGAPVSFSGVPAKWAGGGMFQVDDRTIGVISRGIGMERGYAPQLRFLCRPQIIILNLGPADHCADAASPASRRSHRFPGTTAPGRGWTGSSPAAARDETPMP